MKKCPPIDELWLRGCPEFERLRGRTLIDLRDGYVATLKTGMRCRADLNALINQYRKLANQCIEE